MAQVILSHHIKEAENVEYPANVEIKPDVKCIKDEEEVQFVDDTCCRFDDIILCTGKYQLHVKVNSFSKKKFYSNTRL